jgi:hypothetical protein
MQAMHLWQKNKGGFGAFLFLSPNKFNCNSSVFTPFLINLLHLLLLLLLVLGKNVSCCFFFLCLQLVDSVVTRDG